jgi:dienelactone hydrolase
MATATRTVTYGDQDTTLTGLLAWDDAAGHPLPGLLLVHGGAGLDDHAKGQARRYAAHGYAVLACDMFGDGVAGNRERVMACLMGLRDDPQRLSRRAQAGLAALAGCPEADGRLAAVGFCFGGLAVLTLARSGADVPAVVSIHGSLATVKPAEPGAVKARVLACHGALDPHVPLADVVAFAEEMGHAGADWQLIMYGGAMHGFTHEHATPGAIPGVAYDAPADRRSFAAALAFLAETLPATAPRQGTERSTR